MNSRSILNVLGSIFLICSISGCQWNRLQSSSGSLREIAAPAAPGSISPRVTSERDGGVILSWLEPQGDTSASLRFSVWRNEAWSEPSTIAAAQPFSRHPSESPGVIALSDRNLIAYWTQKQPSRDSGTEEADVYLSLSSDGESSGPIRPWSTPPAPEKRIVTPRWWQWMRHTPHSSGWTVGIGKGKSVLRLCRGPY
jgi:hypothetical protein